MIAALAILGTFFAIVGTYVGVKLYQAAQTNKQFKPVPGIPGCTVAVTAPATAEKFKVAILLAAKYLVSTNLFSLSKIMEELGKSSNIVSQTMSWRDRAGQMVGGSTEYSGMQVSSDYSSSFHELVNLLQIRTLGDALDTKEDWTRLGLWAVDGAFRAELKSLNL